METDIHHYCSSNQQFKTFCRQTNEQTDKHGDGQTNGPKTIYPRSIDAGA